MLLTTDFLQAALHPYRDKQRFHIAYSGGIDSHVLLHLCAQSDWLRQKMTAIHVHHGLQADADAWQGHCAAICRQLQVPYTALFVDARAAAGQSPEEAARNARYEALAVLLGEQDILLTAQHLDDQLETVLLQLFRGSGLQGLSGMPRCMPLGKGLLLRPLLDTPRQAVVEYARRQQLSWVEDHSNRDNGYSRNFLRNRVIPLLKQRWPAVASTVSRSAGHCAEAQALLQKFAQESFQRIHDAAGGTLSISALLASEPALRRLVLRQWFQSRQLRMPSMGLLEKLYNEVLLARLDSDPQIAVQGWLVRRYRDRLYLLRPAPEIDLQARWRWPPGQLSLQLHGNGRLQIRETRAPGIDPGIWRQAVIEVGYRQGGESLRLPGRQGRHKLKKLFQEAAIPPWERARMPLLFIDGQLAAVADKWLGSEFSAPQGQVNWQILWTRDSKKLKDHDENGNVD